MRALPLLLVVLTTASFAKNTYWLEGLVDRAAEHQAPAEIQSYLQKATRDDVEGCANEQGFSSKETANYFAATPVDLGLKPPTYIAFPAQYCMEFFGAHSISFWLLSIEEDGTVKELYTGRQDGVEVTKSRHNGAFDIRLRYNQEVVPLRFNGKTYVKARSRP